MAPSDEGAVRVSKLREGQSSSHLTFLLFILSISAYSFPPTVRLRLPPPSSDGGILGVFVKNYDGKKTKPSEFKEDTKKQASVRPNYTLGI